MYIGHYAMALGAKKAAPKVSLGTLFLAAAIIDLLMSVLMLIGVEHLRIVPGMTVMVPLDLYDYPISHSLAASIVWSFIFGMIYYLVRHSMRGSLIIGLTVFSHWVLDFITHTTDLPLFPGSTIKVGLGIWNHAVLSVMIEGFLFAAGIFIYLSCAKSKDKTGRIVFWLLMLFLLFTWIASMAGPPPPNAMALAIWSQLQWIVIIVAYWIDRHRKILTDA